MRIVPYLILCSSASAALLKKDDDCDNAPWDQCGGTNFQGETCCPAGYDCTYSNDYFSGCSLEDLCLVVQFGQCGGTDSDGNPWPEDQKCCPDGFECSYTNAYYSQCIEKGSNNTDCSGPYEQCGGQGFNGTTCCTAGYECTEDAVNPQWYSGCTPIPVCTNAAYGQCGEIYYFALRICFFCPHDKNIYQFVVLLALCIKITKFDLSRRGGFGW
jgi:hypothetical protein